MSIGVPIKVLHEAEGHIVTVETMLGEVYRGKLLEAEDNMNVQVRLMMVRNILWKSLMDNLVGIDCFIFILLLLYHQYNQ